MADHMTPLDVVAIAIGVDPSSLKVSLHSGAIHFFDAWRRDSLKNGRWRRVIPGVCVALVCAPIFLPMAQTSHPDWNEPTCYGVAALGGAFFGILYKWVSDRLNPKKEAK